MANLLAVLIARDARLGPDVRRRGIASCAQKLTAYASVAVHGSIGRALDFAGLGSESLRLIAVDSRQRIDLAALEQAICADRARGFTPFLVVGTAGTVDTGAIDNLDGIAELGARHQLWFHVDGAYGALAMLAPELAPRLKGIERADSLAFDFHKWAQVPYDAGFILVRDGERQQQAFASSCAYLMREQRGMSAGSPWPCDLGPDLSRGFRALKTWATLKVYGMNAIGAVIQRSCELARYLERCILGSSELELMAPVELNIVCFRYRFADDTAGRPAQSADRHPAAGVRRGRTVNNHHRGPVVDPRSHGEPSHQPSGDGHPGGGNAGRWPGFAPGTTNQVATVARAAQQDTEARCSTAASQRFATGSCRCAAL